MTDTLRNEWTGQTAMAGHGDLGALLAVLDRPSAIAPVDDGLHRMLTSIAALRSKAAPPR